MHVSSTAAAAIAVAGCAVGRRRPRARLGRRGCGSRRVRDAQRLLLGGGRKDLVEFAVSLQGRIDDLHRAVDEVAASLARVDRRIDGSVSNTSIVRYDAYEDTGGHQSASLALLDAARSGHRRHRDPGPRLRADLHEGARPWQGLGRAFPRRSRRPSSARWAGKRPDSALRRDSLLGKIQLVRQRSCARPGKARPRAKPRRCRRGLHFRSVQQVLVLNASYEPLNVCSLGARTCSSSRARRR